MPPRDPLTFPKGKDKLDNMRAHMTKASKKPHIGVTQGGSSRKWAGAKPAATTANYKPKKDYRK